MDGYINVSGSGFEYLQNFTSEIYGERGQFAHSLGPVDKSKKTAETHRGPSRIINLGIAKDGILPSA